MADSPSTRLSLLARLRDPRDEQAWTEFVEIYTPLIHQLARRKGLQEADVADLTQDLFRAVSGAIERWDPDPGRGSFRAWLFRIARNLIIDALAARRRHPRGSGDTEVLRRIEEQPDPNVADDSALFDSEYRRRVFQWAAAKVKGEFREATWNAFWRTSVEGAPARDVARSLGMTAGAVYVARSRVMARLKQAIDQVADGDEPPAIPTDAYGPPLAQRENDSGENSHGDQSRTLP
jgi:RNA polymerase sigma-70 factor (ECF subfamily)